MPAPTAPADTSSAPSTFTLIIGASAGAFHQKLTAPADVGSSPSGSSSPYLYDANLPPATLSAAYAQNLTGGGGTSPYSFAIASGSLPAGVALSSAGALTGTPTATGTSSFSITITDANGAGGTQALSITVNPASTPTVSGNYGYAS